VGRRFGQHFLARKSILDQIASAACPEPPSLLIEIGPGKGALTEPLLSLAPRVIAIEVDPILVQYLRQKFREPIEKNQLTLIEDDILRSDLAGLSGESRPVIAGNLPYYITSPILERVFSLDRRWQRAVFLVQAEVGARLVAQPGSKVYGYLSVLTQVHARADLLLEVSRTAFRPIPKVDSAVVRLEPRDAAADWGIEDRNAFLRFASVCFRHKRKTLRNNLSELYGKDRLDSLPEGRLRAEQMGIAELAALHRKLEAA